MPLETHRPHSGFTSSPGRLVKDVLGYVLDAYSHLTCLSWA